MENFGRVYIDSHLNEIGFRPYLKENIADNCQSLNEV